MPYVTTGLGSGLQIPCAARMAQSTTEPDSESLILYLAAATTQLFTVPTVIQAAAAGPSPQHALWPLLNPPAPRHGEGQDNQQG